MSNPSAKNRAARLFRHTIAPLGLVLFAPPFVMLFWYTNAHLGGSFSRLLGQASAAGPLTSLSDAWGPYFFGSSTAWTILAAFAAMQLAFMRLIPGREYHGPPAPSGHVPVYKRNGVPAFLTTIGIYVVASFGLGLFPPTILYDRFGELLGALNLFSLIFCLMLYVKGRIAPSGPDHRATGNFVFDFFQGIELYPRIFGWDVKVFTNCRFGMMAWPLLLISFAAKQHELSGLTDAMLVSVSLQLIYITKFFYWEPGYLRSIDIMHDRAGYYICWGVLVWLPCIYTSQAFYLVQHPITLGLPLATVIVAGGVGATFVNYAADAQRQRVRASGGRARVWGKPAEIIEARYTTGEGEHKQSILLVSGFWGLSRHFHYLPELVAAACWTAPVLFAHFLPWFYLCFLTILLVDRAFRDERRCAAKYGEDWDVYRSRVPWRIIPGVF